MKIQFASHKKVLISFFVLINIYSYCNGQITDFSLQQSYIGVRTPTRTINQSYYEFWDSNIGWAGIYCGNIVSSGNLSVTGDIKVNNQWFREYHNNSIGIGNGTNGSALYLKALSVGYNYGTLETKLSNTSDLYVAGNVGIGTTNLTSGSKLEVAGNQSYIYITNNGSANYRAGLMFLGKGTFTDAWQLGTDANANKGNDFYLYKNSGSINGFTALSVLENGNVGIGTETPTAKLHVINGDMKINNQWFREYHNNSIGIGNGTDGSALYLRALSIGYNYGTLETKLSNTSDLYVLGNVGIGVTDTKGYKLAVDGAINAKEVKITATVPSSDFVFDETYKLKALPDVEKFINDNKHLPEVPSAADFKANGYSVGEMDDLLLRKVEELTLYVIQLSKQNEELKKQLEELKK